MVFQAEALIEVLSKVRARKPVVHAITNWVTANEVANALHAVGARPILAISPEEVKEVTSRAGALVLNLGTPSPDRMEAMLLSGRQANQEGIPVLFDPVGVGVSRFRIDSSGKILSEIRVTAIRGNPSEIGILSGQGGQSAGIDSIEGPLDMDRAARSLSEKTGAVVVASGPRDLIVSPGEKSIIVENGHPLMGRVTGMGCMLTAVIGAFHAVENGPLAASVSATAFFGLAGEEAALKSNGPGTFKSAFLDALFSLTPDRMREGIRIKY